MSVLPLVFPSNISCFSRGSFKEELARKRELPVPPLPKRSGVWAKSNEDLQGFSSNSGSISPVSSHSSASRIRFTSDTCLPNTVFRNEMEEYIRDQGLLLNIHPSPSPSPTPSSDLSRDSDVSRDRPHVLPPKMNGEILLPVSSAGRRQETVTPSASLSTGEDSGYSDHTPTGDSLGCDTLSSGETRPSSGSGVDLGQGTVYEFKSERSELSFGDIEPKSVSSKTLPISETEEKVTDFPEIEFLLKPNIEREKSVEFRETDLSEPRFLQNSLPSPPKPQQLQQLQQQTGQQHCISTERMNTMFKKEVKEGKEGKKSGGELFRAALERLSFRSSKRKKPKAKYEVEVNINSETKSSVQDTDNSHPKDSLVQEKNENNDAAPAVAYKPPLPPGRRRLPASASYEQSRPLTELDSALKKFRSATAESRENLTASRPNLELIMAEVSKAYPGTGHRSGNTTSTLKLSHSSKLSIPPPRNTYVDSQWEKLSASMANLNQKKERRVLLDPDQDLNRSTQSLLPGEGEGWREGGGAAEGRATFPRTQSVTVLNHTTARNNVEVPENRLQLLSPHQTRIRDSMERINVPSWFSQRPTDGVDSSSPALASRRSTAGSRAGGWRRHVTGKSAVPPTPTTVDHSRSRWTSKTLPLSYKTASFTSLNSTPTSTPSSTLTRKPYLGWRSQERLDIGPAYLATPTQRLASTATYTNLPPPPPRSNTLPPSARVALSKNIKQVSEEIIDYCKTESDSPSSRETTPMSSSPAPSSPSPPPKPMEAWSDTPMHSNGRNHMIFA